jgi:hypothetical protein
MLEQRIASADAPEHDNEHYFGPKVAGNLGGFGPVNPFDMINPANRYYVDDTED